MTVPSATSRTNEVRRGTPMTPSQAAQEDKAVDWEQMKATERWMRRQRMLSPFRRVWHRLLGHEVGRYACFTCDMDLP